jgi:hypothetical protein
LLFPFGAEGLDECQRVGKFPAVAFHFYVYLPMIPTLDRTPLMQDLLLFNVEQLS